MILLFDWLTPEATRLAQSLELSGIKGKTVVLNDDGCLPETYLSPYTFFCQIQNNGRGPLYFNQLNLPDYWQITGTNTQGEIWNYSDKKANIYYHTPTHLRYIKHVDWLKDNRIYLTDHYNAYGDLYAKSYFTNQGKISHRRFFDQTQKEVIYENVQTGNIILHWQGKTYYFEKKMDFYLFFFKESQLDTSEIWYNSLSAPFMISYNLGGDGNDILFWQERIDQTIPGNMQFILDGKSKRTKRVVVQDYATYSKILELVELDKASCISYLGYIYPEKKDNHSRKTALILTNSDQIQYLDQFVMKLPNYHFHIAALTEMSPHLMSFGEFSNVTLYPNIAPQFVTHLYDLCDVYLDINCGSEVLDAVQTAFEYNQLILSFENTKHQNMFILPELIFKKEDMTQFLLQLETIEDFSGLVAKQRHFQGQMSVEHYQLLLSQK